MKLLHILLFACIIFSVGNSKAQELIINDNTNLVVAQSAILVLGNGMDLVNNSSNGTLNGTFVFKGTSPQKIAGSQAITIGTLNIENNAFVDLATNVTIGSQLNLHNGIINLLDNNLLLEDGAAINGIFSESNMIVAEGTGQLKKELSSTGTYLFPVGDTTGTDEYTPAELTISSGSFSGAVIGVNLKNSKHPSNPSISNYLNRYWKVEQTGITGLTCDIKFAYTNDDIVGSESNMIGGYWNGSYWSPLNGLALNEITGTVESFSEFTGGENAVLSINNNKKEEDLVEILVNGKNITINAKNEFPIEQIEVFNKIGQKVYSYRPVNALHAEISVDTKPDVYLFKLSTREKTTINKKVFIW